MAVTLHDSFPGTLCADEESDAEEHEELSGVGSPDASAICCVFWCVRSLLLLSAHGDVWLLYEDEGDLGGDGREFALVLLLAAAAIFPSGLRAGGRMEVTTTIFERCLCAAVAKASISPLGYTNSPRVKFYADWNAFANNEEILVCFPVPPISLVKRGWCQVGSLSLGGEEQNDPSQPEMRLSFTLMYGEKS